MDRRGSRAIRVAIAGVMGACLAINALPTVAQPSTEVGGPGVLGGMRRMTTGPCAGAFQIVGTNMCSHGPDPAPDAIRERGGPAPAMATAVSQGAAAVGCDGDGESGKRVQALYAYVTGRENRRSTYLDSFRAWAANIDTMFEASAAETGGHRRPRWVTNNDCLLAVPAVPLSPAAEMDFATMITELAVLGYNRSDRKYLIWFDSDPGNSPYCGIGTVYVDDRPTENSNDASVGYARADYLCWNWTEAHELMHTLGAVQPTAPHATAGLHCTDESDHMCYQDSPTAVMNQVCPTRYEQLFDCGHDDYFHTAPPGNNYLATHWNTADSGWLMTAGTDITPPAVERPAVSFPAGQKLTATARVRVRWSDGSDGSGIAAYELQRRKGSGSWVAVPLSTATATSVEVDLEFSATYTFRLRARDGAGNTGDWATTTPATLTLLQENASEIQYTSGFKRVALSGASGGYVRKAAATGRSATLTFSAAEIAFVTTLSPARGMATIRVDGGAWESLDFYRESMQTRHVAWSTAVGEGTHTVELLVSGVRNPSSTSARVDVDAFLVWKPVQ